MDLPIVINSRVIYLFLVFELFLTYVIRYLIVLERENKSNSEQLVSDEGL